MAKKTASRLSLTINLRIWILVILVVITFAISFGMTFYGLNQLKKTIDSIAHNSFPQVIDAG